jgi:hypothetical protein
MLYPLESIKKYIFHVKNHLKLIFSMLNIMMNDIIFNDIQPEQETATNDIIKDNQIKKDKLKKQLEYNKLWKDKNRDKTRAQSRRNYEKKILQIPEYRAVLCERVKARNNRLKTEQNQTPKPKGRPRKIGISTHDNTINTLEEFIGEAIQA